MSVASLNDSARDTANLERARGVESGVQGEIDARRQGIPRLEVGADKSAFTSRRCGLRAGRLDREAPALPDLQLSEVAGLAAAAVMGSRRELEAWYARRLRPRVIEPAYAGAIAPARAVELERQMRDLLGATGDGRARAPATRRARASD
jgi:hypothetical protein